MNLPKPWEQIVAQDQGLDDDWVDWEPPDA